MQKVAFGVVQDATALVMSSQACQSQEAPSTDCQTAASGECFPRQQSSSAASDPQQQHDLPAAAASPAQNAMAGAVVPQHAPAAPPQQQPRADQDAAANSTTAAHATLEKQYGCSVQAVSGAICRRQSNTAVHGA